MNTSPDPRPNTALAATAALFTAQTGKECPLYKQDQARKPWYATDLDATPDATAVTTYHLALDASGKPAVISIDIPALLMRTPNIDVFSDPSHPFPGWNDYVKAQPPTSSTYSYVAPFDTFPPQALNVEQLETPGVANTIASEIANDTKATTSSVALTQAGGVVYQYDPADPRRVWQIVVNGKPYDLALLLQQRFASGEWCPGSWGIDAARGPVFTPEVFPPMPANTTTIPVPIDPKYADATQWEAFEVFPGVLGIRPIGSGPVDVTALTVRIAAEVDAIAKWVAAHP